MTSGVASYQTGQRGPPLRRTSASATRILRCKGVCSWVESSRRPATGLHLIGPNLIYSVGRVVHYVPVDGSAVTPPSLRVVFTIATGVVACAPQAGSIFVADRNGAIVWHSDDGSGQVKQAPGAAFITSMAYDGARSALTWTQMAATWQVHLDAGANHFTFTTGANPRLAVFNPPGDLYWVDDVGVIASR